MVVSTAKQLDSTYQLWKRFTYPSPNGPTDAIAVPKLVGDQLNSTYSVIIEMALVHVWSILFGIVLYLYMRRRGMDVSKLSPLAPTIWNKRADLVDLIRETVTFSATNWRSPAVPLFLLLVLVAWVGQTATGILVPPHILLGNAAPVNPEAIYVPDSSNEGLVSSATLFPLEVPRFIRALGSTAVDEELRQKVNVSAANSVGQTSDGQDILRIDYSYRATGVDFGLQRFPDLTLNVAGSCITDYGWFIFTRLTISDNVAVAVDYYDVFGLVETVSLFDGREPVARFYLGNFTQGTLATSNATWAAVVSSVNRTSFSPGTDPWYLTGPALESATGAQYAVRTARPVLSCWQDDVWSYQGHNSTIDALTSNALPGLELSDSLQIVLNSILGSPMIEAVGQHLQASALQSTLTASAQVFDAEVSSVHNDLERLVQAAYVATVNCLTDLTLYPTGAERQLRNIARGPSGQIEDGVAEFVVWSPDVTAVSTVVVIIIPTVFLGAWLVAIVLLYWTPVKAVTALDSNVLQQRLKSDESHETVETSATIPQSGTSGTQ
ncbi:hypothetical protein F4677DRAFT_465745 [Hypoxylon crocopeplum]|nr:hypothetical protein F4677DRAFT_465745 [Hypoxylon crocopeplum]